MAEISGAPVPQWQLHDLRRTARTYLSRVTSADIAERTLGHVVGGVRAHYDCYEYAVPKRDALALWAQEVARIVSGKTGKVITMRGRS
jgi:integrase